MEKSFVHWVEPGGTGFPKPVAPVSVGSTGYTRDLLGYSYLFTPFTPPPSLTHDSEQ
jgi:hypothetical protein